MRRGRIGFGVGFWDHRTLFLRGEMWCGLVKEGMPRGGVRISRVRGRVGVAVREGKEGRGRFGGRVVGSHGGAKGF